MPRPRCALSLRPALCAPLVLLACGGDSAGAGVASDAATRGDATASMDAVAGDAAAETADVDAAATDDDVASDATDDAAACPSIGDFCEARSGSGYDFVCVDWATAQSPATWCAKSYEGVLVGAHCGGYNIVVIENVDGPISYYYDPVSGDLVGIEVFGGSTAALCIAGQFRDTALADCYDGSGPVSFSCQGDGSVSE